MRLPASLRAALYASAALVAASGVLWLPWRNAMWMQLHGTATMFLLVVSGSAVALHAPGGWREGKNRLSGALLSAALIVLAATGALLYYAGDDSVRAMASVVHWVLGLGAIAMVAAHVVLGRRSARTG
jgi:hypothetical protein